MPYTYPYPRPSVTADTVVFTMRADDLAVLLIRRKSDPFKGAWALPGGFVDENEALDKAAARELEEETGLEGLRLEQLGAFGDPGRDPRGHTVTVAYVAFVAAEPSIAAGDDASEAAFVPLRSLDLGKLRAGEPKPAKPSRTKGRAAGAPEKLAFDHARILRRAYARLLRHLENPGRDPVFELVPPRFTLAELRRIYEVVIGKKLSPREFRKNMVDGGIVAAASTRPAPKPSAQLYRWRK